MGVASVCGEQEAGVASGINGFKTVGIFNALSSDGQ